MKKLFFDTEFTGLHQNTTLISIGIVSDCGCTFYAEFSDYDYKQIDSWIEQNVMSKLKYDHHFNHKDKDKSFMQYSENKDTGLIDYEGRGDKQYIFTKMILWMNQFSGKMQMWSDCLAYDWVLFNNLFGNALNIPDKIHYIPMDICTLFEIKGVDPDINREEFSGFSEETNKPGFNIKKHNALWDAIVIKECYNKLIKTNDKN